LPAFRRKIHINASCEPLNFLLGKLLSVKARPAGNFSMCVRVSLPCKISLSWPKPQPLGFTLATTVVAIAQPATHVQPLENQPNPLNQSDLGAFAPNRISVKTAPKFT